MELFGSSETTLYKGAAGETPTPPASSARQPFAFVIFFSFCDYVQNLSECFSPLLLSAQTKPTWLRLPREAVSAPALAVVKARLEGPWSNLT